jgi:ComF family protein
MSLAEPDPEPTTIRFRAAGALRALGHAAREAGARVIEIVYPAACAHCRAPVQANGFLCAPCWSAMPFIERPFCERSGAPFAQDLGDGLISPDMLANPPAWARARAVVRYEDGPARLLVRRLKYGDRLELAKPMGLWMARAGAELLGDAHALIPVPLHRGRLFSRRFNQAAALATSISRASGIPFDPLALRRVKATVPQVGLSRAQRADNVQGAFRVTEEGRPRIAGRNLVLVDDVLTSGATIDACARALLRGGAQRVDALVFARVVTAA